MKDKSVYSKYKIYSSKVLHEILEYEENTYKQYMYPHLKDYALGVCKSENVTKIKKRQCCARITDCHDYQYHTISSK